MHAWLWEKDMAPEKSSVANSNQDEQNQISVDGTHNI